MKPVKFIPSGLLIVKSNPDGAQFFVNGENKGVTNSSFNLVPGNYDISIKKEGFMSWNKRLEIKKEVVTELEGYLFKAAPSLSAITFSSTQKPIPSYDFTKIAYLIVSEKPQPTNNDVDGLWVIEQLNLPLGFSRDPRRISDGDLADAIIQWSPDGREILLTIKNGSYLLPISSFTPQTQMVNVSGVKKDQIIKDWSKELTSKRTAQLKKLPDEIYDIFQKKVSSISFSPDEQMILYTASQSATIPQDLVKPMPGASTQKQERDIKPYRTYVYDIKEDRNFLIDENSQDLLIEGGVDVNVKRRLSWFPTSKHLILAQEQQIVIMDYDGTNRQVVFSGAYASPFALPTLSTDRLIILTNLGANSNPPNLYSLTLR
jgi:dipeptidyl aminopeptidase/acylaminoacyl peptidase